MGGRVPELLWLATPPLKTSLVVGTRPVPRHGTARHSPFLGTARHGAARCQAPGRGTNLPAPGRRFGCPFRTTGSKSLSLFLVAPGVSGSVWVYLGRTGQYPSERSFPRCAWLKQRWSWTFVLKNLQKSPKQTNKGKKNKPLRNGFLDEWGD